MDVAAARAEESQIGEFGINRHLAEELFHCIVHSSTANDGVIQVQSRIII